ncbi:MAG: hypothetical protein CMI05_05705 [Oceanospirillaceae bacterium]|nr:hypothetical protein [Oceanospirillaceae bacterium]
MELVMKDEPGQYSLALGDKAYSCDLIPYGQEVLYPSAAGVYLVVRLGKESQEISVICLFTCFSEGVPSDRLHNPQIISRNPTHLLFYPKHVGESLLEFFNQCHDCYPPELNETDLMAPVLPGNALGIVEPRMDNQGFALNLDAVYGAVSTQCPVCSGSGRMVCSACGGMGGRQVMNSHMGHDGNPIYEPEWESCYSCNAGYVNCSVCGGSG